MLIILVLITLLLLVPITIVLSGIYQFWKGKRLIGSLIAVAGTGIGLLLMIPPLFFLLLALSIGPQQYLKLDQKLMSPDGTSWFALYHDYGGIGDPEWYVYKIPINEAPEELKIPTSDARKVFATNRILIMWNWSEAGHESNPHIKIFNQRYLVFTRGGYYHGLYYIQQGRVLVTDISPWHSFMSSNYRNTRGLNYKQIDAMMDMWVQSTLHNPIKEIIENNQTPSQIAENTH